MATNINVSIRYSNFLPVLMEVMEQSSGDVLELGPGVFSTPYLHWVCKRMKRNLVTLENDEKWFNFCRRYYQSGRTQEIKHRFIFVKDWNEADKIIKRTWDVVLVDHSPSERRVEEIKKLANLANFIIIHDADDNKEKNYHYSTIYPLFKYRCDFRKAEPGTTVLSNFVDLNNLNEKLTDLH
jgi:predicted O-methyltransferase YrrM